MNDTIVSLTKKLIAIDSDPHKLKELDKVLAEAIKPLKPFTIEHFNKDGVKSVLVYNTKKRPKKFKILLNGHLDIIPGKDFQYKPFIKGDKLYGVGSMDMKANTACLIYAFAEMANKVNYPLGIQLVTDEELGGFKGTKYQLDRGVDTDFVIVGEATHLDIENQMKGILWAKILSKGVTAHGAYPWRGKNAIWLMKTFLDNLSKKFPEAATDTWQTTVNVSQIETANKTYNKIPDDCTLHLDIRFIPKDAKTIVPTIKKLLPKGLTLEIVVHEPAHHTDKNNIYIQKLKNTIEKHTKKEIAILSANGSSDVRHFSRIKSAGVEFGPIGGGMGSDNEWVSIKSLNTYYAILIDYLSSLS